MTFLTAFLSVLGALLLLFLLATIAFRYAVHRGGRLVEEFDPSRWIIHPKVESDVQRKENGSLHLLWEHPAPGVNIQVGTDPDFNNPQVSIQSISGVRKTIFTGLDPGVRHYFKLDLSSANQDDDYLVASERILPLRSVANLRDLGGYRTREGLRVRWGQVYRSGNLGKLSDADREYLQRLEVQLVIDLRNTYAVQRLPDILPAGARYQHYPVYEDEFPRLVMPVMLFNRHRLGETLGSGYTDWLEIGAPAYSQLLHAMANPDNLPVLFHCSAGKDRAGIAAAILLSLLGIPKETIIADYSLTNLAFDHLYADFVQENQLGRLRIPPQDAKIMLAANPAWIQDTLNCLEEKYGGADEYARNRLGLSTTTIGAIREIFLMG